MRTSTSSGKLLIIAAAATLGLAGKSGHSLCDVSLKADSLLFAVVADIDPRRRLFVHDLLHGFIHGLPKLAGVYGANFFTLDKQIGELVISRQAADMSNQNSFTARLHSLHILHDKDKE